MANSPDVRLLSIERWADIIQHMSCGESHVQIQFASASSFRAARRAWEWVNQIQSRLIILVTGGDGCVTTPGINSDTAGLEQDETYAIVQITFSPNNLMVNLIGNTATLGQLLEGHWKLQASSDGIIRKGLQPRSSDSGDVDLSEQVHIPNLFDHKVAGPVNVSLDAVLSSTGSLHWDIELDGLNLVDAKLTLTTTGVSFTLTPQLSLSGSVEAIPAVSVDVPEIPLGPSLSGPLDSELGFFLVVGAQASLGDVSAEIDTSVDLELALSDGSVVIAGDGDPSHTGFAPTFSVHSPQVDGQVSLKSSVGPTIALVMQATLGGFGVKGGIQLEAPEADMTVTAGVGPQDSCGSDGIGIGIDIGVGAALDAIFAVGDVSIASTSSFSFYHTSTPVFQTCTAFGTPIGTPRPPAATTGSIVPSDKPSIPSSELAFLSLSSRPTTVSDGTVLLLTRPGTTAESRALSTLCPALGFFNLTLCPDKTSSIGTG